MIRRRFSWVAAVSVGATAAVMFWLPLASLAKPGAVTDKGGKTYVGDVSDAGADFAVTDDNNSKVLINKGTVASTVYFDTNQQEFDARMKQLDARDARGRVGVAKWAIKKQENALAIQALDQALKIEPGNIEAATLRKTLGPATPDPANPPKPAGPVKPRLVTKEEINQIRQAEWHAGDEGVRINIDKQVKADFLARSRDITPQQFNRMAPVEQGRAILKGGTDEMRQGVHLLSDPAPILNFRRNVQKTVLTGCAAAGCHDAATKTSFMLYTEPTDEAAYTDYLILQNYRAKVGDRVRLMIDRDQPDESLLSEFMLPARVATTPHPEVANLTTGVRAVQDPKFKQLSQWIHGLPTIPPNYGVDITKPPEGPKPAIAPAPAAGGGATVAPAPAPPPAGTGAGR